jgi:hypothetical protein
MMSWFHEEVPVKRIVLIQKFLSEVALVILILDLVL